VDGDGDDDVICHFKVPALVRAGLNGGSTSIEFRGRTFNGMCVEGSDAVRIVPPRGRK